MQNFVSLKKIRPMNIEQMIRENATVVDVRTPMEFFSGSVAGSINIPLNELQLRLDEIKQLQAPLVLCCASGGRSGQAAAFLKNQGIICENGGSWLDVNYMKSLV
jgi:phage shock protein E